MPTVNTSLMSDRDHNRQKVYALDTCFWGGSIRETERFCVPVSFEVWTEYAEMLFTDGLRRPYHDQIRRTRRTPSLRIDRLMPRPDETCTVSAYAYLRSDRLEVSQQRLLLWLALHEVAHLLVPACLSAPHYWRWMSVYAQMMQRHVGAYAAGQFLALAECFRIEYRRNATPTG